MICQAMSQVDGQSEYLANYELVCQVAYQKSYEIRLNINYVPTNFRLGF